MTVNPFGDIFAKAVSDVKPGLIGSEGSGNFPKLYHGLVSAQHLYRFWFPSDLSDWTGHEKFVAPLFTKFKGFHYYDDVNVGTAMKHLLLGDDKYPAEHVVYLSAPATSVLNFQGNTEKFESGIGGDVTVVSLTRGKKNTQRAAYHLLYLPALVEATAVAMKLITERPLLPVLNELYDALMDNGHVWDYDYQLAFAGDGLGGIFDTKLGKARADLWKMLGEPDPTRYEPEGENAKAGAAGVTTATNLVSALRLAAGSWSNPIWARFMMVPNPIVDATNNAGDRLTVPCLTDFYITEAEAQAAADAEKPVSAATGPVLPAMWRSLADAWVGQVRDWKKQYPNATLAYAKIGGSAGATEAELAAWWDVV